MSKWTLLLDKNTFINFDYIKEIFIRYRYLNLFVFALFTCSLWFQFANQNEIFLRERSFISVKGNQGASTPAMVNPFGGESKSGMSLTDLRGIVESWEFVNTLVERVTIHPMFKDIVFTSEKGKVQPSQDLLKECNQSMDCVKASLAKSLPEQYKIVKNVGKPGFTLRVHGFEEGSVRIIEDLVSELLIKSRFEQLAKGSTSKEKVLQEMISKRQKKLGFSNVEQITEQIKIKASEVKDLEKSIREVQFMRNKEKAKLFEVDLKLKYLAGKGHTKVRSKDRANLEKLKKLEKTIIKLSENIELLKMNNSGGGNTEVIKKLIQSRNEAKIEARKLDKLDKSVNTYANAQKNRNEVVPELIVKSNVIKENVRKLASEMKSLSKNREELLISKSKLKTKLEEIEPEIELLNQIKRQYSETLIKQAALKSDLDFESIRPESEVLKEHSLKKMVFLNLFLGGFLVFFITIIRFFFDASVYSKKEIETLCKGLKVLGNSSKVSL